MTHTEEQLAILTAAASTRDNLMISALAGTGKTSTLEAIEKAIRPPTPILYLVFNKKNATEAEARMSSTTIVRTFNSLGFRIWAAAQSRWLNVDPDKTRNIFRAIVEDSPQTHREAIWSVYPEVMSGVALAKSLGYIPSGAYRNAKRLINQTQFHSALDENPDDLTSDLIDNILLRSIRQSYQGLIDLNDQVYMPALFGGPFPRYPLVLVDEYQDLSPVNHALLQRLVRDRLIGVGDPYQNIYGFRGAKADGMKNATVEYSCTSLPLSISFRCPSEIVRHVHWRVPHFRAHAEGGSVAVPTRFSPSDFGDSCTIICRNNAPLLSLGFSLLASGRSISVAGTDIGPRLVKTMRKLGPEDMTRIEVIDAINRWLQEKLDRESKSAPDLAACMKVFAEHGKNLSEAIIYAEHLFRQQGSIYLTTGHKAKGLEWPNVFHLDPWIVRKNPTDQDKNLDYVISTRSSNLLTEIDTDTIEW